MGIGFNSSSVKQCRVSALGDHFGHHFTAHSALGRGECWSQAEHVPKWPFRDELHSRKRRRRNEAPSHPHGPPLASTMAELGGVVSISQGEGEQQPWGKRLCCLHRVHSCVPRSPGTQQLSLRHDLFPVGLREA